MPATGCLSGTPASIRASEVPQTVAIEDEPFELGDLGNDAQRIGEVVVGREDGVDRPPGELAMADLTPSGRPHAPGFAHRVRREIVVEHEGFLVGPLQRIDVLLVVTGTERGDRQGLGLAAGEQRAAMGTRQDADLGQDRPHGLEVAAVDADAALEDVAADDRLLELLQHLADELRRRCVDGAHRR